MIVRSRHRRARRLAAATLLVAGLCTVPSLLGGAPLALAQPNADAPSDADRAAAQVLFDEGRALMADETYEVTISDPNGPLVVYQVTPVDCP